VSSTHIAIGWIFWVWLTRQLMKRMAGKEKHYIEKWMVKNIALAWIITLPVSGAIAAWMFYVIMFLTN
jgi:phosphate/sulfate permease